MHSQPLWHPVRGAGILPGAYPEVAAPRKPRRHPASLCQPFGLNTQECLNFKLSPVGREAPDILTRFAALDPKSDSSPQPSPPSGEEREKPPR